MGVKMKMDMVKYTREFSRLIVQAVGTEIRNEARDTVRLDTTELRNSIRFDLFGRDRGEVSANTPWAAAQEWGRPDLANYGFTPYMRPSAIKIAGPEFPRIVKEVSAQAERMARV